MLILVQIHDSLATQSVLLRLTAGSQEAGYLAAIFPLPKTPALVVIRNGELKEYIAAGVSKDDFLRRLQVALASRDAPLRATTQAAPVPAAVPQRSPNTAPPASSSSTSQTTSAVSSEPQVAPAVQAALAERAARLEAHKKQQDAAEKAKRIEESKARREAAEASQVPGSASTADQRYAMMQKKRQQEARNERARILKRVEDDKAERREREARRKSEAKALAEGKEVEAGPSSMKQAASTNSKECAIQIRLFDGSTIRSRFPSSGSLRKDVRPWIDQKQIGDVPYTFKQVLTPMPNKNIETSEEEQSLQTLGLTPSCTLILLPVSEYTSAYKGNSSYISKGVFAGYSVVASGVGMVNGILERVIGPAQPPTVDENRAPTPVPSSSISGVRTLRDQESRKDDQQFYNGNAVSFPVISMRHYNANVITAQLRATERRRR